MNRPRRLVLVTGTGTGVGKTWWTANVAARLRDRGITVAARKPVQSFRPDDGATDADILGEATGASPPDVCPPHRWYPVAAAPPMAAQILGRSPFTTAELVAELSWPDDCTVGFVEGVGGPRSPLSSDGDGVDLGAAVAPGLTVLVADAGLGAINAVRLCADVLATPLVVVLNRFDDHDDLHRRNREWLEGSYDVVVDPDALAERLAG